MPVTLLPHLSENELNILLNVARSAVRQYISNQEGPKYNPDQFPAKLNKPAGCFVTLEVNGELQGCLGSIYPPAQNSLIEEVAEKARSSCFEDTRFPPLEPQQLKKLTIEVSVLSIPKQQYFATQAELEHYLSNNKCGLILTEKYRRSVFLPQVWEQLQNPEDFIRHLKLKGGWRQDYWSQEMKIETFVVSSVSGDYK